MSELSLFRRYPGMMGRVPHIPLGTLPTPVERVAGLGPDDVAVYVKRDDVTGDLYGGNKVRKLEFLLAEARARGCERVVTVGGAGSNHALCTAIYAKQVGLRSAILLFPQPNAYSVRRNLLMDLHVGTDIHCCGNIGQLQERTAALVEEYAGVDDVAPMFIPGGGSSPTGAVGYVNAALELADQFDAGVVPCPGRIYVALGTMGTAVGLVLGLRAAGLACQVVGVRVVPTGVGSAELMGSLLGRTSRLLHEADAAFPLVELSAGDFVVLDDFYGEEYGLHTAEGTAAVQRVKQSSGVELDGTYTGKTAAAMLAYLASGEAEGPVLFWDTKSSRPYPPEAMALDYHGLPPELHRYFEEDVQPLERS
jgi:1-aminocyclopropane-1-carboxylate deaminase/D-cysteine desulfhydrase-like pyridoxal-dependent ACC family enzyme